MVADIADTAHMGSVEELIRQRRSIRRFREEAPPRALIVELLRAALCAPSPHNSQPWRFTVLFDQSDKARLAGAMAEQLRRELEADSLPHDDVQRQTARSYSRISTAPVVLLCSLEADGLVTYPDVRRNDLEWQMAVQSVGAALQTFFLAATERNLGACWMAAPMYCPEVVRASLGLPQSYVPQALVLLGYAASPGKARPRRPFDEVVDLR
jgi:coenzyme F420-0:L-glutamate ligase / coenzyme F420-1:gamma-L-glutamate ligase